MEWRVNPTDGFLIDLPGNVQDLKSHSGAVLVLAHGAGAPMDSDWMNTIAVLLAAENIVVIRFEFDYMAERRVTGKRRPPDRQPKLLAKWLEVIAKVRTLIADTAPLWIGGKSMGGRMATMVADETDISGVVALGYPFYAPKKQEKPRTEHLETLKMPCLILQGTRDPMGEIAIVEKYSLSSAIRVHWLEDGDHDFKPRRKSGFTLGQHQLTAAAEITQFFKVTQH